MAKIEQLEQTIHNKNIELTEVCQLNHQLERRIRELEKALESEDSAASVSVAADCRNAGSDARFIRL